MDEAEIDEAKLRRLVHLFYARVRQDPDLGPVFNDVVEDWPEHLEKLTAFWSSLMLASGRYKGNPLAAHTRRRDRITPELFQRWLALWRQTTDEVMSPGAAAALQAKAGRISESLQLGMFFKLGSRPQPGHAPA
ncbi:MAG TPA: group III truncated hemoglobin [Sphingomonas sp.]|nr:group III truncated hemoglobin [Sphingomonas sp.]